MTISILDESRQKGRILFWMVPLLVALWGCDNNRELPEAYQDVPVPGAMLRSPEVRSAGAQLFFAHCSQCHGEKADGKGTIHRQLSSNPVDFTNREWRDNVSPKWVYYVIREGRKHTAMAGSARRLDDESCWKLTAYVLSVAEQ